MTGDVSKGPGGGFFHTGIEFFEANDQGIKCTTVDNLKEIYGTIDLGKKTYSLGKLGRVFGNSAENKRGGLLVKAVLLGERVHELRENVGFDDGLGQIIVVVGEAAEGESSCLLDGLNGL